MTIIQTLAMRSSLSPDLLFGDNTHQVYHIALI